MSGPFDVLNGMDSGVERATTLPELDRKPNPWESSMQATCECLSWRGALDNLERRHAEDELGESVYQELPVHTRSVVITAHALMERGAFSQDELAARMKLIRRRLTKE
ncbi:MAG TPA: ScnB [Mycobacterium sp.]|nr:ScnB [Mycobacterium sp.]